MPEKRTVFITGATGLLGSYLLKILLENGQKVYALARAKDNKSAKDRVAEVLKFWDDKVLAKIDNLVVLEGDITKDDLGFDKRTRDLLKNEVEEIFHCAAITEFNWSLEAIRKINTEGTNNLLNLSLQWKSNKLKKVNHISTAYIYGNHKGIFTEGDLDLGQKFATTYEQSKFEAEKLVESYREKGLPIDIFRPPFIIGESTSGKIISFKSAFYQVIHIWCSEIFDTFPVKGLSLNIVPVDILSQSIFTIATHSIQANRNYHPFLCKATSLEEILDTASKIMGFKKPKPISLPEFNLYKLTFAQKMLLHKNILSLNPFAILDSTSTNALLNEKGFTFPDVNKDMLSKILLYAAKTNFKYAEF